MSGYKRDFNTSFPHKSLSNNGSMSNKQLREESKDLNMNLESRNENTPDNYYYNTFNIKRNNSEINAFEKKYSYNNIPENDPNSTFKNPFTSDKDNKPNENDPFAPNPSLSLNMGGKLQFTFKLSYWVFIEKGTNFKDPFVNNQGEKSNTKMKNPFENNDENKGNKY